MISRHVPSPEIVVDYIALIYNRVVIVIQNSVTTALNPIPGVGRDGLLRLARRLPAEHGADVAVAGRGGGGGRGRPPRSSPPRHGAGSMLSGQEEP